jgi:hypothetical protein
MPMARSSGSCSMRLTAMPTEVGIHVSTVSDNRRRGWWAFAHHDAVPPAAGHLQGPLVSATQIGILMMS